MIHLGSKVYNKDFQYGEPFEVIRIVDDQRVKVKDEYGNTAIMFEDHLVLV